MQALRIKIAIFGFIANKGELLISNIKIYQGGPLILGTGCESFQGKWAYFPITKLITRWDNKLLKHVCAH